jgi:S-adenosylmethionine:tRNA ribosyltransferase-isomerase
VRRYAGETRLFIQPGYRFHSIDLLLTNFHLPRSPLFMLVAALAGLDHIEAPTPAPSPTATASSPTATRA